MSQNSPLNEPDIGYIFYPASQPDQLGHPRLDIILLPIPTGHHFDPYLVRMSIPSPSGTVDTMEIYHPYAKIDRQSILAGRIIIEDRVGKCVEAFTFGGELQVISRQDATICIYQSPAPILSSRSQSPVESLLLQEVEILLAERRAAWLNDIDGYESRLAAVSPIDLFHACLEALRNKFAHYPVAGNEQVQKFTHYIKKEEIAISEAHHITPGSKLITDLL